MAQDNNWLDMIDILCFKLVNIFITKKEFENVLTELISRPDCPLHKIEYQITFISPFEPIIISVGTNEVSESERYICALDDVLISECRIRIWQKGSFRQVQFQAADIRKSLNNLFQCFWKPETRDRVSGLPNLQKLDRLEDTISYVIDKNDGLCLFFCDLDNFKIVNDTLGMSVGDRVILELASVLDRIVRPSGICFHRSGDEFIILLPSKSHESALRLAFDIMSGVKSHDFKIDLEVGISAGITVLSREEQFVSYKDLEARAEKAVKAGNRDKLRGKARFAPPLMETEFPKITESSKNLAHCIMKTWLSENPFESVWLNLVSSIGAGQEGSQNGRWKVCHRNV